MTTVKRPDGTRVKTVKFDGLDKSQWKLIQACLALPEGKTLLDACRAVYPSLDRRHLSHKLIKRLESHKFFERLAYELHLEGKENVLEQLMKFRGLASVNRGLYLGGKEGKSRIEVGVMLGSVKGRSVATVVHSKSGQDKATKQNVPATSGLPRPERSVPMREPPALLSGTALPGRAVVTVQDRTMSQDQDEMSPGQGPDGQDVDGGGQ